MAIRVSIAAMLATAASLLVGCGATDRTMPDVVGLTGDEAFARVCASGLRPTPSLAAGSPASYSSGWTAYTPYRTLSLKIIATSPSAGAPVARGREVILRARDPHTGGAMIVRGDCP